MIDPKDIVQKRDLLKANLAKRQVGFDFARFDAVSEKRTELLTASQELQALANQNAKQIKQASSEDRAALIEKGKQAKEQIASLKQELTDVVREYDEMVASLPNWTHPSVPDGGEEDFQLLETHLEPKKFSFPVKDHLELMLKHDLIDFEKAAQVTGSKFYYLKNEAVYLEQALKMHVMDLLYQEGFTFYKTPDLAKSHALEATGYSPRGQESQIYRVEGHDLNLIGTSEITLGAYYAGENLDLSQGPRRMLGLSHCFRTESGSYGSHSKGLYRVHQFSKVELYIICRAEDSEKEHQLLLDLERKILDPLQLPYRVIDVASGDLGAPASRKFDIEAWMPGREGGSYGEVTSASNCLDFQSRRLKIKTGSKENKSFVHTLNATALAVPRVLLAILENGQQEDGSIEIPKVLHRYLPFTKIGEKHLKKAP